MAKTSIDAMADRDDQDRTDEPRLRTQIVAMGLMSADPTVS